jgi:hypothetical protein
MLIRNVKYNNVPLGGGRVAGMDPGIASEFQFGGGKALAG